MDGSLIALSLQTITGKLRDENYLRGLGREGLAIRAAAVMVDLNGVHPFREGNGRTQRIFMGELAQEAGVLARFFRCQPRAHDSGKRRR
jgi:cell filamentation protein